MQFFVPANRLSLAWNSGLHSFLNVFRREEWKFPKFLEAAETDFLEKNSWIITTSLAMILSYLLNLPSAGIFLLAAVVHSVLTGGWKAGLASATLSAVYSAIFLSSPGHLLDYAPYEWRQLIGLVVVCYGIVGLIVYRKRRDEIEVRKHMERLDAGIVAERSEKLFREMADGAPILLWMSDEDGRRFYFNRPWLEFTGKTLAQESGEGWRRGVHPQDLALCLSQYSTAIQEGKRFDGEYRLRTKSGEYNWVNDSGIPRYGMNGKLIGFIGACIDRSERKNVEKALHQLTGRLLELQDDERRRIARELHDTTAQNLAVLSMNLCVVKEAEGQLALKTKRALSESLALAEQCSQELRTVSYLLHPPLLDELGLVSALRSYTTGFTQRTGIQVELKVQEIGRLPRDIETTVFRIVQEALTNVHRHSCSPGAEVRVIRDPKEVKVQVSDEGKGIIPDRLRLLGEGASLGVGVAGMRERASQLGGNLKIASSDKGTTIIANLPLGGVE